eukprot:TRINITY_DN13091_c0_g1_i1.p2 TRINITY_DN13091_c0_g1~~TRINITY_DN13091_c0_g1_i1.p2  ORF type:complete len:145 (-),score=5.31 TRINITY_DN13091_c0_g1_i1:232-666(-)
MKIYSGSTSSHFIDREFEPTERSLLRYPDKLSANDAVLWSMYAWTHCSDLPGNGGAKVVSSVTPLDVKQGSLGNCYFISTLVSLAAVPERIQRLFDPVSDSEREKFSVNVYPMGIRTKITVDGYLPYAENFLVQLFESMGTCLN